MMGITLIVADAAIYPQLDWYCVTPSAIAKVTVFDISVSVNITANKNSFQDKIKQNIDVAASPGLAKGNIILRNDPILVSPSTIADSSNSLGISFKEIESRINELHEHNPMLGHRGCRLGISFPEIYEMQCRAIFEALKAAISSGKCLNSIFAKPVSRNSFFNKG